MMRRDGKREGAPCSLIKSDKRVPVSPGKRKEASMPYKGVWERPSLEVFLQSAGKTSTTYPWGGMGAKLPSRKSSCSGGEEG